MKLGNIFHSNKIIESDNFIDMACKKSGHDLISNKTVEHLVRALNKDYEMSRKLALLIVGSKDGSDKSVEQLSMANKCLNANAALKVSSLLIGLKSVNQQGSGKVFRGVMDRCEQMLRVKINDSKAGKYFEKLAPAAVTDSQRAGATIGDINKNQTKVTFSELIEVKFDDINVECVAGYAIGGSPKSPLKSALKIHQPTIIRQQSIPSNPQPIIDSGAETTRL